MKKVLIIAYYFPPDQNSNLPTPIGSLRPWYLAKYLPEFGWEPIVLTAKIPRISHKNKTIRIFEVNEFDIYKTLRNIFNLRKNNDQYENMMKVHGLNNSTMEDDSLLKKKLRPLIAFPDRHNGWYFKALEAGKKIIINNNIDAIISTSHPATTALVAHSLKKKYKIPWICDFRDLWTQYHRYHLYGGYIRKSFEMPLEISILKNADYLVTVTEDFAKKWRKLHHHKKIFCFTNVFDPDDFKIEIKKSNRNYIKITYTGKITPPEQDIEPLFIALSDLIRQSLIPQEKIKIYFYGPNLQWINNLATKYKLENSISIQNAIPRNLVLKEQFDSDLLLNLSWENKTNSGVYPGKIFEYFGAGVPVLSIGKCDSLVGQLVQLTNTGVHTTNIADLKNFLLNSYRYLKETGKVPYNPDKKMVDKYTAPALAKRFAELLNDVSPI